MQAKEYEKALKVRSRGYVQIARGFFWHLWLRTRCAALIRAMQSSLPIFTYTACYT